MQYLKNFFIFISLCLIVTFFHHRSRAKWRDIIPSNNELRVQIESTKIPNFDGLQMIENFVTSGKEFKGHKIRRFPANELKFEGISFKSFSEKDLKTLSDNKLYPCGKWGVMTTIFHPISEAVRRFMYRKEWCIVVVGDKGKPSIEVKDFSL